MDDEGDRRLSVEPLTKRVQQGGLSRAHVARQDDESLPLPDPGEELSERLTMRRAQVEGSGIRCRVEGLRCESVERQVHASVPRSHRAAPETERGPPLRW